jgi:acyl-CoA thioesterase
MKKFEDLAPNFKHALMNKIHTVQPYWNMLGIKLVDIKKGWAKLKLPYSKNIVQPYGAVHGGAIFSLADSALAMALIGLTERDEKFTTVEMKINYISSFNKGEVTAEAKVIGREQEIVLGEVNIVDEEGRLVAKSMGTYFITKHDK